MVKKLGAIGAGGHARLSHFGVCDNANIVAIYDPSSDSQAAARAQLGGQLTICESVEALLAHPGLDGVLIMTPDETHPALLLQVVRAGLPVLCEKPLAIDQEGLRLLEAALQEAESRHLLVASCHPRRDRHTSDLPYGWVLANLARLAEEYGNLWRIGLSSIYPKPRAEWKGDRSFLLDKFVHDIDYMRFVLGPQPFRANRLVDSHDHYEVTGEFNLANGFVQFGCVGTRLHTARDEFIEIITLSFERGECTVYTKTGVVRIRDRRTNSVVTEQISPMDDAGYDRIFRGIMQDFVDALGGGTPTHSPEDLLVVTRSATHLAAPGGTFSYTPR